MNALILLAALLAPPAHADNTGTSVPQLLSIDLDGDGKPDMVQTVASDGDYLPLTITLSKDGKVLSFDKIIKKYNEKTCGEFSKDEISAGPNNTLLITKGINTQDDAADECRYSDTEIRRFRLVNGALQLENSDDTWWSWSMGSTAPHVHVIYDFIAQTIALHIQEHHEFNVDRKRTEKMEKACHADLASLNKDGFPLCASQQEYYMAQELFPEDFYDSEGASPCPTLNGAYVCTFNIGNDPEKFTKRELVIHRVEAKMHRYDIASDNPLIADGKTRMVRDDDMIKGFQTTSCRRETLKIASVEWMKLFKDDPRKPIFDKEPYDKKLMIWTQLDTVGKRFQAITTEQTLNNDGSYRMMTPEVMDCTREEEPGR